MTEQLDLTIFDRQEVVEILFPLVYSPYYSSMPIPGAQSGIPEANIEVESGVIVRCGFWPVSRDAPSILYFHGNGESVPLYNLIAPLYNERGINLFVADYRGYGFSSGKPTVSNVLSDADIIFRNFREKMNLEADVEKLFIMGRSLGSLPAIDVSLRHQDEISGLIIESGTANNFRGMWSNMGLNMDETVLREDSIFLNKVKMRQITIPTLIIHGEDDELIPVSEGKELYNNSTAPDKKILVIPGAGHNDIMTVNHNLYFETIGDFMESARE